MTDTNIWYYGVSMTPVWIDSQSPSGDGGSWLCFNKHATALPILDDKAVPNLYDNFVYC